MLNNLETCNIPPYMLHFHNRQLLPLTGHSQNSSQPASGQNEVLNLFELNFTLCICYKNGVLNITSYGSGGFESHANCSNCSVSIVRGKKRTIVGAIERATLNKENLPILTSFISLHILCNIRKPRCWLFSRIRHLIEEKALLKSQKWLYLL